MFEVHCAFEQKRQVYQLPAILFPEFKSRVAVKKR